MNSAKERGANFSGLAVVTKGAHANQSRFRTNAGGWGATADPAMRQPARRTSQSAHARGTSAALTLPGRGSRVDPFLEEGCQSPGRYFGILNGAFSKGPCCSPFLTQVVVDPGHNRSLGYDCTDPFHAGMAQAAVPRLMSRLNRVIHWVTYATT